MVRQLEFDETEALTAAMHLFRRQGYAGVSIKTLEAETGLSSGSIYNSFGSKHAVFERALKHYNDAVVSTRIRRHLANSDPLLGLISLFESLLDEPDGGAFGCLLTNSAIEFPACETQVGTEIQYGFDLLQMAFAAALQNLPNIPPGAIDAKALQLLAYYQGLLVLIRHGFDKSSLRSTLKSGLESIIGE